MNKILVLLLLSTGVMLHNSVLASEAGDKPTTTPATAASGGGEGASAATAPTVDEGKEDSEKGLLRKILFELTDLKQKLNTFIQTTAPAEEVVTAVVAQTEAVSPKQPEAAPAAQPAQQAAGAPQT